MKPVKRIAIPDLRCLLGETLVKHGCNQEDAYYVADDYIEAELRGKRSHGVIKFIEELEFIEDREGSPKIVQDTPQFVLIDAQKEIGPLAARFATSVAIERATRHGISIVGMKNMQRYGSLRRWVKILSEADLVGVVANTCEPVVVPPGGTIPILGSNPIAIGIPTSNEPIIVDMATSKVAVSTLLQSTQDGTPIPQSAFLNEAGEYATVIDDVRGVEPFGGYKGYALGLVIEILAGSMIKALMGKDIVSQYEAGHLFLAINPSIYQNIDIFKKSNDKLVEELRGSLSSNSGDDIFAVPGDRSRQSFKTHLELGYTEIPLSSYETLTNM